MSIRFVIHTTVASLLIAGVLGSTRAAAMPLNTLTDLDAVPQQSTSTGNLIYVGAKAKAFDGCRAQANDVSNELQDKSVLRCMKANGYNGWCVRNLMCFEADRLDTKIAETIARLL
jgi:hypothetical protein